MDSGLYEEKATSKSIGFFRKDDIVEKVDDNLEDKIIQHGIIPELVGRIHAVVELDRLTKEDYHCILDELVIPAKNEQLLALTGDCLALTQEDKDNIVNTSFSSSQGVRYLYKQIDKLSLALEHASDKYDFIRL